MPSRFMKMGEVPAELNTTQAQAYALLRDGSLPTFAVVTRAMTVPEPVRFFAGTQAWATAEPLIYRSVLDPGSGTDNPRRSLAGSRVRGVRR